MVTQQATIMDSVSGVWFNSAQDRLAVGSSRKRKAWRCFALLAALNVMFHLRRVPPMRSVRSAILIFAVPILLVLIPPVAAAQSSPGQAKPAQSASAHVTAIPTGEAKPWTGDLDGMLKRRYIRALVVYSKTQYYVVKGVQRGISYEELNAFQDFINRKYPPKQKNLRTHVVFVPVQREQLVAKLEQGYGDLAVGILMVTPERQKIVDFSDPMATGVKEIVVTGPDSPTINSTEDLSGQEIFVRRGTSHWEHLQDLNAKFKSENKPLMTLREAPADLEDEDLLEMLNAGLVHIVVTDDYMPRLWGKLYTKIQAHPEVTISANNSIAWAMRKNSPELMGTVNEFVKTHKLGSAFGNSVIQRYIGSSMMLKSAIAPASVDQFNKMVGFFQRYSNDYHMDYLLMMAQGFQESGLNQAAKSQVGAIGIMQLMPATGAQMKVGDVHEAEANVHAGVKYIRFMVDQYFANEPMNDTNKVLFAFASYNAGPGRIHQLRQVAAQRGLDPNVWFDNVEVIAAEKIGMETVTYVSNIYKYYVAYKLVAERKAEHDKAMQEVGAKP
jgi:membrane-bound lytic murein transglycosylase MltF